MKRNKSLVPLMIFVICFLIGFSGYNTYYYFENIYGFNIGAINRNNITKIDNSNVWNTVHKHYTQTVGINLDTYKEIYTTPSLNNYMDKLLSPYYEQYGYDCVLASGLKSNYKIANIYALEKCCELIGEKKLNKDALLKYLKKVSIEEKSYDMTDEDSYYITYAKDRLNLAINLLSGSTSSNMIAKHSSSNIYCWTANGLNKKTRLRMYTKSGYITAKNHYINNDSKIEFVSNNVIKILSSTPYAVCIDEDIIMYDIDSRVNMEYKQNSVEDVYTYDLVFSGYTVSGKIGYKIPTQKTPPYGFTFDLKTEKVEINNTPTE